MWAFVVCTTGSREKVDLIIVLIVLLLLFGGGGGLYWGMGAGWGLGPLGLIVAVLVISFLLFGYRGRRWGQLGIKRGIPGQYSPTYIRVGISTRLKMESQALPFTYGDPALAPRGMPSTATKIVMTCRRQNLKH